jgi:hypothetical protein
MENRAHSTLVMDLVRFVVAVALDVAGLQGGYYRGP